MLYTYGATVIEIVRRKEFCGWQYLLPGSIIDIVYSAIFLSARAEYLRNYGKDVVSTGMCVF